jgi:hypothetical protein
VIFEEGLFEFFVERYPGLDKKEHFFGSFLLAAPAVVGFKTGKDLDTCRETPGN